MPIPVVDGDLVRSTLYGRFNGVVETRNVFYHRVDITGSPSVGEASLAGVAQGLWESIQVLLGALTQELMRYYQVETAKMDLADWLAINAEIYGIPSDEQAGAITATQALPPMVTATFKYIRPSTDFRHGFKRFAGFSESFNDAGIINPANQADVDALAETLFDGFYTIDPVTDILSTEVFLTPQIVKTVAGGEPVRPVEHTTPANVVYDLIGTQNSRKFGHGS